MESNIMTTLVEKRNLAGERYAAAIVELRAAFGEMSILDQHCRSSSFGGPPPEIVPLRHPTFAPNVSGSFTDDVHAARARISAEPV
jgi:hypothetical protein